MSDETCGYLLGDTKNLTRLQFNTVLVLTFAEILGIMLKYYNKNSRRLGLKYVESLNIPQRLEKLVGGVLLLLLFSQLLIQ